MVITYAVVGVVCWVCGLAVGLALAPTAFGRLIKRLDAREGRLQAIVDMENRRVAYDSGRETLARSDGGSTSARVSDGMATKPGSLARYLRDSALTKKFDAERG